VVQRRDARLEEMMIIERGRSGRRLSTPSQDIMTRGRRLMETGEHYRETKSAMGGMVMQVGIDDSESHIRPSQWTVPIL